MSGGEARVLRDVRWIALTLKEMLAPRCERIEVVGSVRRQQAYVHDIELLATPRFDMLQKPGEMWLTHENLLDVELADLARTGVLIAHPEDPKNGARYKKLYYASAQLQVDLFLCRPPAEWGPLMAIRTGPADFSRRLVTRLRDFGARCEHGQVQSLADGEYIPCPTEERFFELCGQPWLPPERRG